MRLALFDLDNTLLGGDSDHAWGDYLCQRGILDPVAYKQRNDGFYQDYLNGTLDLQAYLAFSMEVLAGKLARVAFALMKNQDEYVNKGGKLAC